MNIEKSKAVYVAAVKAYRAAQEVAHLAYAELKEQGVSDAVINILAENDKHHEAVAK